MISVGIDVAKGKSTICVINQYGEIFCSPKDYKHNIDDLNSFNQVLTNIKKKFILSWRQLESIICLFTTI